MSGHQHVPVLKPRRKSRGTNLVLGWVGPRADLHKLEKKVSLNPCREPNSDSLTTQHGPI